MPRPILCADRANGAAQMAAIRRPLASCALSTSPTNAELENTSVPPNPPGKITTSKTSCKQTFNLFIPWENSTNLLDLPLQHPGDFYRARLQHRANIWLALR